METLSWFDWGIAIESLYKKIDLDFTKLNDSHLCLGYQMFDGNLTESMRLLETLRLMDYFKFGVLEFNSVELSWARLKNELEIGEIIKSSDLAFLTQQNIKPHLTNLAVLVELDKVFPELFYKVYCLIRQYHLVPLFDETPEYYQNLEVTVGNQFSRSTEFTEEMPY